MHDFSINVAYSWNLQPRITTKVTWMALGLSMNVTYSWRFYRQYGNMMEYSDENSCYCYCEVVIKTKF